MNKLKLFLMLTIVLLLAHITLLHVSASSYVAFPAHVTLPKTIRVVMDDNYPPYIFKSAQGQLKGILVDQWSLWEKKTGIHVELTGMDWKEAQRRMQAAEFDVIDTMFKNEKRQAVYDFTKPYARLDVPLFFDRELSGIRGVDDLTGFPVAVKAGDAAIDFLKKHGITTLVEYPSYEKLIEAARDGKVNVFTVDRPPALYYLNKMGIKDHFRETAPLYSGEFHRAVLKGRGALLTRVERGFSEITPAEYRAIDKKWMGSLLNDSLNLQYVGYAAAIILFLVFCLLAWLRLLKNTVARKTKELSESTKRFHAVFDSVYDAIFILDVESWDIVDVNQRMCAMYGMTREDALRATLGELSSNIHPYSREDALRWLKKAAEGKPQTFEWLARKKDGELFWVEVNMHRVILGITERILITQHDISERKKADQKIQRLTNFYAALSKCNEAIAHLKRDEDLFRTICQLIVQLGGMQLAWIGLVNPISETVQMIAGDGPGIGYLQDLEISVNANSPFGQGPAGIAFREKRQFWCQDFQHDALTMPWHERARDFGFHSMASLPIFRNDSIVGILCLYANVTDAFDQQIRTLLTEMAANISYALDNLAKDDAKKQAEKELRKSEEHLRLFFDYAPVALAMFDKDMRYIYVSNRWRKDYGLEHYALTGVSFDEGFPEIPATWRDAFRRGLAGEILGENGDYFVRSDGVEQWISWEVHPWYDQEGIIGGIVITTENITEQKRLENERLYLERQLQHAQKMESLGVLSSGIAHDFNNILAVIIGHCAIAKMNSDNTKNSLNKIEKAAERAAELCRQMLTYAGKASYVRAQVDMGLLVNEMVNMLKSSINQNAVIKHDVSADIPPFEGDVSQLRQIVMNMIINGAEAIGDEQGEIIVSLYKTEVKQEQNIKDHTGNTIPSGSYVCLEVADNGCGMDDEAQNRIFEPFYTTKFSGRGLGMSTVLGIITAHEGFLQLFSEIGKGTTFKVILPLQQSVTTGREASEQSVPEIPWKGSGTILLVEDEELVRHVAKELLNVLGFAVLEATDGKQALELYRRNVSEIVLVFTDIGMPVMNGYELFNNLKKIDPELPVIISSGFGDADVASRISRDDIAGLINKPYNLEQLRNILRKAFE